MMGLFRRCTPPLVCFLALLLVLGGLAPNRAHADEDLSTLPDEDSLIAVLDSADAEWRDKYAACVGLRIVGTAKSVPALASLLHDEQLSNAARYALEPMPIPEASDALREALTDAPAAVKAGLAASIGARRDAKAVPHLVPLLGDADRDTASAAAGALGRIATAESVAALKAAAGEASGGFRTAIAEGLLASGDRYVVEGRGSEAVPLYESLLDASWPLHVRLGAFHGVALAAPAQAPARMIEALSGDDESFRNMAAFVVAEMSGDTARYAEALPGLPEAGQVALLRGLADRGDASAHPAVVRVLSTGGLDVKRAAIDAIGVLGSAEDAPGLIAFLAHDDDAVVAAATNSLAVMDDDGVNRILAASIAEASPGVRAQVLQLLASRSAAETAPVAVQHLTDDDMGVRLAALDVLILAGTTGDVSHILDALKAASAGEEQSAAARSLDAVCARSGVDALPVVLEAMDSAEPAAQVYMLNAISRIGGPQALDAILAAVRGDDDTVSDGAVRQLAAWRTLDAAPHLLELAQSEPASRATIGLQGYVRLARDVAPADTKAAMLSAAMDLARRTEDKWLVLSAWGALHTPDSLKALLPHLDDGAVRNEAASAIIGVATALGKSEEHKAQAAAALEAVLEKIEHEPVRQRAANTLAAMQ